MSISISRIIITIIVGIVCVVSSVEISRKIGLYLIAYMEKNEINRIKILMVQCLKEEECRNNDITYFHDDNIKIAYTTWKSKAIIYNGEEFKIHKIR